MAFALLPCPYCGGAVAPADGMYHTCQSCGKMIYISRADLHTFPAAVEREDLAPLIDMVVDDNLPKALSGIDEIIGSEEINPTAEPFFVRGLVYARMGEDGKALNDWKKGIEMLETYRNIDAYVCLMANSVAELIYYKETEFISFEYIRYIDRLGDILYECTGDCCKMILYNTVYRIYLDRMETEEIGYDDSLFRDIVPPLFRRVIEYHRDPELLIVRIDELLRSMDYDEAEYEEDDFYELHLYYLVRVYLEAYIKDMSSDALDRIKHYWNDENMKQLADRFELIVSCIENPSILDKLKAFRSGFEDTDNMDIKAAVNDYVKMYLLLDNQLSDVAKVLQ